MVGLLEVSYVPHLPPKRNQSFRGDEGDKAIHEEQGSMMLELPESPAVYTLTIPMPRLWAFGPSRALLFLPRVVVDTALLPGQEGPASKGMEVSYPEKDGEFLTCHVLRQAATSVSMMLVLHW
jgi:hypothetical protein